MLQVIAYDSGYCDSGYCDSGYADSIETAWGSLDAAMRDETIRMVTVTEGDDAFTYQPNQQVEPGDDGCCESGA